MSNITNQSLSEILESIKSKKISSLELTQAYVKNIENAKKLNAFVITKAFSFFAFSMFFTYACVSSNDDIFLDFMLSKISLKL